MIRTLKKLSIIAVGCFCLLMSIQQLHAAPIVPPSTNLTWQKITSVKWSTDKVTWGNAAVEVGDTVYFQFQITKDWTGEHYKDLLKAWIDKDKNNSLDQAEYIFFDTHTVNANTYSPELGKTLDGNTRGIDLNPDQVVTFTTTSGITFGSEGTFDMLVRATCSADVYREKEGTITAGTWLGQWGKDNNYYNENFSPTDTRYSQGDAKLYKIEVKQGPPPVVPEPSTVLLLISGLIGIAGIARRKK